MPSITCVPLVVTLSPGTCSRNTAPAITERAALPVQSVTRCSSWSVSVPCTAGRVGGASRVAGRMPPVAHTLVLLRHGESEWNLANLFTGWVDVDLTEQGRKEAGRAGRDLADANLLPDIVH